MLNKTLIIAEAGVNHNGSIEKAKLLIDAANSIEDLQLDDVERKKAFGARTFLESPLCSLVVEGIKDENGELRKRVPAGYYSKPDNIRKELIRIKPKSLSDWQKKNDNSYVWAWKLGIQRELFDEYLSKSEITQGN